MTLAGDVDGGPGTDVVAIWFVGNKLIDHPQGTSQPMPALGIWQAKTCDLLDQAMDLDEVMLDVGPSQQRVLRQVGDAGFEVNRTFVFDGRELFQHRQGNRIGSQPAEDVRIGLARLR